MKRWLSLGAVLLVLIPGIAFAQEKSMPEEQKYTKAELVDAVEQTTKRFLNRLKSYDEDAESLKHSLVLVAPDLMFNGFLVGKTDNASGLQIGDKILRIDGKEVKSHEEMELGLESADESKVGSTATIVVERQGKELEFTLPWVLFRNKNTEAAAEYFKQAASFSVGVANFEKKGLWVISGMKENEIIAVSDPRYKELTDMVTALRKELHQLKSVLNAAYDQSIVPQEKTESNK